MTNIAIAKESLQVQNNGSFNEYDQLISKVNEKAGSYVFNGFVERAMYPEFNSFEIVAVAKKTSKPNLMEGAIDFMFSKEFYNEFATRVSNSENTILKVPNGYTRRLVMRPGFLQKNGTAMHFYYDLADNQLKKSPEVIKEAYEELTEIFFQTCSCFNPTLIFAENRI